MKFLQILSLIGCILVFGCQQKKSAPYPTLPGYDLASPIIMHLRSELDEISGLAYYAKDTSLFAINDETGLLYKIYVRNDIEINRWKFDEGADFEDVVLVDSTFHVLQSNGNIYSFKVLSKDSVVAQKTRLPDDEKNEFEAMYYDEVSGKIILICKDCKRDNKKMVSALAFDPRDFSFSKQPFYELDGEEIVTKSGSAEKKFKPSAAAINPVSKDLYIISSVSKCIVVADRMGKIKNVVPLNPRMFKQPEGITFSN